MLTNKHYDAIIVGAGLNGSWAAKELAQRGMNIATIDAGEYLNKSFFINKWQKNEYFDFYTYKLLLKKLLSSRQTNNVALLYRANKKIFVNNDKNPVISNKLKFNWIRSRVIGGRGHTWGRVSPRFTDREFNAKKHNGIGIDWPINLSDLSKYYDQVESLLKLGWDKNHSTKMSNAYIVNNRSLNFLEKKFAHITQKKWPNRIVDVMPVMEYDPGPISPMLEIALETSRVCVYQNYIVRKILTFSDGLAKGVELINTKTNKITKLNSDLIILSASPFESIKILQSSISSKHPKGIGNSSGLLGKYIAEHVCSEYFGYLPKNLTSNNNNLNPFKPNNEGHGFYIAPFKMDNDKKLKSRFQIQGTISETQKSINLIAFGESSPSKLNCLQLDNSKKDKWGIPITKINYEWSKSDIDLWKLQNKIIDEMVTNFEYQLNIKLDRRNIANIPQLGTSHECGGARMGGCPVDSIVNEYNRVWDSPNILVCDASIFPSISFQNPANTSMAITIRACENIAKVSKNLKDLNKIK